MFSYARRLLSARPALWLAALGCAALVTLPGAIVATLFVPPATMLLLTGDPGLAIDVIPEEVTRLDWLIPSLAVIGVGLSLLFNRLYAVLLWESDEERGGGWRASWSATRQTWLKVLALNALLAIVLVAAIVALAIATALALTGSAGAATLMMLGGTGLIVTLRTVGRIVVTLACRAALLDDTSVRASVRSGIALLKERRRHVVAAWASLLALGVAVWIGGRFVSPILQDTALDFPLFSSYLFAREGAQLALAIPLEAFLLVAASAVWTAVYRGIEVETVATETHAFAPRALGALVVLVVIANGVPAIAEVSWRNREETREEVIRAEEIAPEEAISDSDPVPTPSDDAATSYDVRARLDGDELNWTTTIRYTNEVARAVDEVPLYIYPAAFSGEVEELPFADDLLSSSIPNDVRGQLEGGTFRVARVTTSSGRELEWERRDTVLRVQLARSVQPDQRTGLQIALEAKLPTWPLRYGVWDGVTQLGNWIPTVPVQTPQGFVIHPYTDTGDPFFAETSDYSVTIETEEEMGVVGSGRLVETADSSDRSTWRFVAPDSRDAGFAVGSSLRGLRHDIAGTTLRTWYNGEDTLDGDRIAEDAASALSYLSRTYGPLDMEDVDVVATDNPLGGMEYPGLVYVSSGFSQLAGLPLLPELVEHSEFERVQERYITGHEIAHQWWYAEVGNDQAREPWLDEGFAEASTRLWLLETDEDDRVWKIAHLESEPSLTEDDPIGQSVAAFDGDRDYSDAVYDAGGELLIELRSVVGAPAYERLMRMWLRTQRSEIGTIDEFLDLVDRVVGGEGRALLERHLFR